MTQRKRAAGLGRPNAGPARRSSRPAPGRRAGYTLVGRALEVDAVALRLVMVVEGGRRPGPFAGRRIEVQAAGRLRADDVDGDGRITLADVRPGDVVAVHARLPRRLAHPLPRSVQAARVDVLRRAREGPDAA
jgi:hypothetical protein